MREDNIAMLQETLQIMRKGSYSVNGKTVKLKLMAEQFLLNKLILLVISQMLNLSLFLV